MQEVTEKRILAILLSEKYSGVLRRAGSDDIVKKLMHGLSARTAQRKSVLECLDMMAADRKLIIERCGVHVTLIATPDGLAAQQATSTEVDTTEGEVAIGRGTGARRTTRPQFADGAFLPSVLPAHLVGPVEVRSSHAHVTDAIRVAGELVLERLIGDGRERLNRQDVDTVIRVILEELYSNTPEVIEDFIPRVLGFLVDNRHITRESGRSQSKTCVYTVKLPEVMLPSDLNATLALLLERAEAIQAESLAKDDALTTKDAEIRRVVAESSGLRAQLEDLKDNTVSAATVEELATTLEESVAQVHQLTQEMADKVASIEELGQAHSRQLQEAEDAHSAAASEWETEKERLLTRVRELEQASRVDGALQARVDRLLAARRRAP